MRWQRFQGSRGLNPRTRLDAEHERDLFDAPAPLRYEAVRLGARLGSGKAEPSRADHGGYHVSDDVERVTMAGVIE
jgi:hypothetical protein